MTTDTYCSPDVEYLTVRCRPFYLPREFTVIIITAVYIPPDANTKTTLGCLLSAISKQQRGHPDGVYVIAGDFNKTNLKTVLTEFHQHIHCPTRGRNTLDHVYRPHICMNRSTARVIQVWPEGASEQLQNCFSDTDWTIFQDDNIDTYTSSVLFYIKCNSLSQCTVPTCLKTSTIVPAPKQSQ